MPGMGTEVPAIPASLGLGGAACLLQRSPEHSWTASIGLFLWLGQTTYPPLFASGGIYAFIGTTSMVGFSLGPLSPALSSRGGWELLSAKVGLIFPKCIPRDAGSWVSTHQEPGTGGDRQRGSCNRQTISRQAC